MSRETDLADFYRAVVQLHELWQRIVSQAGRLDLEIPEPPGAAPRANDPRRPGRAVRRRNRIVKTTARSAAEAPRANTTEPKRIAVPIGDLSRPLLCLAILRRAGKPLETGEILTEAQKLGLDWSSVAGGPSNAVHGGLMRDRGKGNVKKSKDGPWELVNRDIAPILDLEGMTAWVAQESTGGRYSAESRRQKILEMWGANTMRSPHDLWSSLKKQEGFEDTTRLAIREDFSKLMKNGKIKKVRPGIYKRIDVGGDEMRGAAH